MHEDADITQILRPVVAHVIRQRERRVARDRIRRSAHGEREIGRAVRRVQFGGKRAWLWRLFVELRMAVRMVLAGRTSAGAMTWYVRLTSAPAAIESARQLRNALEHCQPAGAAEDKT